jgi:diadenosine tetraphosphate (Ap4A) HIT family hydrolase
MNRFWDKNNNYSGGLLKEYDYWALEVSYRQHTFGNFIVFCKRQNIEKISELHDKELLELKKVFQEIESALLQNNTFKPIRFNYWQMGNGVHELHIHGIPRYDSERKFLGKTWKDKDSGVPPIWTYEEQTKKTVVAIKNEIKKFLN